MQEQFKKSFCGPPAFNDPCGSTRCVDIYRDGPDGAWPASNDDDGAWPASNDDDDDGAWPASNDMIWYIFETSMDTCYIENYTF